MKSHPVFIIYLSDLLTLGSKWLPGIHWSNAEKMDRKSYQVRLKKFRVEYYSTFLP